jgi:threonine dehydrogenase-like Zn-dependent dehydrogenase
MKAAFLKAEGGIELGDAPVPQIGRDDVLIRVLVCGVCTSDMGAWKHGMGIETILGHEVVGIVEAVGDGVEGFMTGDRVTGSILQGYAQYTTANWHNLIHVPEKLEDHEALVEPLSSLLSGIRRAGAGLGSQAAVVGTGFMGLSMLQLLKLSGVTEVTAIDKRPCALKAAEEYGAAEMLSPEEAKARYERTGLPLVVELAGTDTALELAGQLTALHGTLAIVGYHPCHRDIDMGLWNGKALTVINAFEYRKDVQLENMRTALRLVESKALPLGRLFTHSFRFVELEQAFQAHERKEDGYLKSFVRMPG